MNDIISIFRYIGDLLTFPISLYGITFNFGEIAIGISAIVVAIYAIRRLIL